MAALSNAFSVNELSIPVFCEIDNELNHELQMMYNHHTVEAWDCADRRIPPHCTFIDNEAYQNEARLFPLDYLTGEIAGLNMNAKGPRIIALTYEVSSLASFARLQAAIANVPRTNEVAQRPETVRLKNIAHRLLSRSGSGKFRPALPAPGVKEPAGKFSWLMIGILDSVSPREVNASDIERFLSTQTGCIGAVECHIDNLEEVTAAFRPAIEEAHRQNKAKREKEARASEEKRWMMEEERKLSEEERRREAQSAINRMRQFEQWFGCLDSTERKRPGLHVARVY
ncbi:hypothetical protein E2P81_ATG08960 [Venturia nashicola]|uniref:Uncharacterized protein n=1 Tax=Venturia nashicola TaxID=86259 RepID=A0A4Z1NN91_9PEZI|nr:hypothetical protein E6O75_ATG09161 [Venturia nashicola]TLD23616.1 hypothetical protein E2P81_ATG08960 [Venturia nashicola]